MAALSTLLACALSACAEPEEQSEAPASIAQALTAGAPLQGVYRWDAPNGPLMVDAFSQWLGKDTQLAHAYTDTASWATIEGPTWQLSAWSKWVSAKAGRTLMYSVAMLPGPANGAGPDGALGTGDDVSLQKCADGLYDGHWWTLATNLAQHGLTNAIVRPGWEFDGDWYSWSSRGKEAQYARCFRRVVTTMRTAQPNNAWKFDWSPSDDIFFRTRAQIDASWPGDDVVDYIGVNGYDVSWITETYPYPASCDAACRTKRQTNAWNDMSRGLYLMRDYAAAHGKLIGIPEWGIWERSDGHGGNDNAVYIEKMHEFVSNPANRVVYQIYFDVNYVDGSHQISDVSGQGSGGSVAHTHATRYPQAAARYRTLFGASAPPPPPPAPLPSMTAVLTNPGFEGGAAGWKLAGTASGVATEQRSGTGALRIEGGEGSAEQDLIGRLTVGARYRIGAQARIASAGEIAAIGINFLDSAGVAVSEPYTMVRTTSYGWHSFDFTVPSGAKYAFLYAYKAGGTGSTAWFDDFSLQTLP